MNAERLVHDNDTTSSLEELFKECYSDGCHGGITENHWFSAYALAAQKILAGAQYHENIVIDCHEELKELAS